MVSYFIYNERLGEAIIETQVLNLISDFNALYPSSKIRLIIFQNLYFWIKERSKRKCLIENIKYTNIKINVYPFALPTRGWLLGRIGLYLHRVFFGFTSTLIPNGTVVCRGYLGTYLWLQLSPRRNVKVIGDPRSLFVRENTDVRWRTGDQLHSIWINIEKLIVRKVDRLIVINQSMYNYYSNISGSRPDRIELIPIYSSPPMRQNSHQPREGCIRLIYVGSLSHSKWNDINAYRKFFMGLNQVAGRIELVLIVKTGGQLIAELQQELQQMDFLCTVHIALSPEEVQIELSKAQVGLAIMDPWEDANARTGVKTIEYLANDLIVWTTSQFSEIASIVKQSDIGYVFSSSEPTKPELEQALDDIKNRNETLIFNIKSLYSSKFSFKLILSKLHSLLF